MNLEQLQGIKDLYPLLRLRSGRKVITTQLTSALSPEGLAVTVKTVFPPSSLRRSELLVTDVTGELHVRPLEASNLADAQRFAELVRDRWLRTDAELAPLRLVRGAEGSYVFAVGKPAAEPTNLAAGVTAQHATPAAKRSAGKENS